MRLILLIVGMLVAPLAHAATIIVMTDRPAELGAALEVALANRNVDIARMPAPSGALRLDRAAIAQRAALEAGADAAIWIDRDGTTDVCAVSPDGRFFRHAPIADTSPRMFAAIATSLLDELLAPPEHGVNVNVHVIVEPTPAAQMPAPVAPAPAPAPRVAMLPPSSPPAEAPAIIDAVRDTSGRPILQVGVLVSPVTIGAELTMVMPNAGSRWRPVVMGTVGKTFDGDYTIWGGALEMRHFGTGRRRHFDVGALIGAAGPVDEIAYFGGIRFDWTWEGKSGATTFGFAPLAVYATGGPSDNTWLPGIFASVRRGWTL